MMAMPRLIGEGMCALQRERRVADTVITHIDERQSVICHLPAEESMASQMVHLYQLIGARYRWTRQF
jgi:hypothetical protein